MVAITDPRHLDLIRLLTVCKGLDIYIETKGQMRLSRFATPARLRELATEYTGQPYARSQKGLLVAQKDVTELYDRLKAEMLGTEFIEA